VPCVLVTSVLPAARESNITGAFTSYQSFFKKGSVLQSGSMNETSLNAANRTAVLAVWRLHLLLATLFTLGYALVLANSHDPVPASR
jgi:hypothetical protein